MTGEPAEALADLLRQDGVRLSGGGSEQACRCFYPEHDDRTPSMSVNVTKGVYHCQGCKRSGNAYTYLHDIRGLPPKDCFDILERDYGWDRERSDWARSERDWTVSEWAEKEELEPAKWCAEIYPMLGGQPLDTVHDYYRADGSLAWCTARYKPQTEGEAAIKGIPFTPAPSKGGGWWNKSPIGSKAMAIPEADRPFREDEPYPVYGLRQLLAAPRDRQVWIVEGEKCADAVNTLTVTRDDGTEGTGPPGVSVRHGYRTADPMNPYPMLDLEPLSGRECLVFADPDEGGHDMAKAIAKVLHLHYDCEVRIMLPPIVKQGETKIDIADVAAHGGLKAIGAWANKIGVNNYQPPADEHVAPSLPPMTDTEHFAVLGFVGDRLAVRRKSPERFFLLHPAVLPQEDSLLQIAPLAWWLEQGGGSHLGNAIRESFAEALLRAGEALGEFDLSAESAGGGAADHHDDEGDG